MRNFCVIFCRKRHQANSKSDENERPNGSTSSVIGSGATTVISDEDEASSFDSDIKALHFNKDHPGHHSNTTPVYWSASQLLTKIEQNKHHHSPQSLQNLHSAQVQSLHTQPISLNQGMSPPLWTYRVRDIPEEYTVTVNESMMHSGQLSTQHLPKPRNITQV